MYTIIEDSGTQIKAQVGDRLTLDIRELPENADTITLDKVLLVGNDSGATIGTPYVSGASVTAKVIERQQKGEKIHVRKYKRRKGYRRKSGHRQRHLIVEVTDITS